MGFLGKLFEKKTCSVCGGEIGLLGNRKLEDGNLCKECTKKLSPWFEERRHSTVGEIQKQLEYREQNKNEVTNFVAAYTYGKGKKLHIDEKQRKFYISQTNDVYKENPDVVSFSQIRGCFLDRNERREEEKMTNNKGETVSYNPPVFTYYYDFTIKINVDSPWFDTMTVQLNSRPVKLTKTEPKGIIGNVLEEYKKYPEIEEYQKMGDEIIRILTSNTGNHIPVTNNAGGAAPIQTAVFENNDPEWTCMYCNTVNTGKFCINCGAKPENGNNNTAITEQQVIGTWTSYSVVDNSGNDISGIFEPDGLKLTLNSDHTALLNIDGEEYTQNNWSFDNNYGSFQNAFDEIDGTEFNLSFEIEGDKLIAKYDGEGLYKEYACSK